MNERQIEAFRATARLGTVTAAAAALNITQPAVSRLLSNLEARVGIDLFERDRKRLKLTAEGAAFLREVEQHFLGLGRLHAAAQRIAAHGTGSLRLLGIPSITSGVLPRAVKRLLADHPQTIVTIDTDTTDRIAPQIESGAYDVGFSTLPVPSSHAVASRVLHKQPWTCVFPPGDALSKRDRVRLRDLASIPLVGFSPGMSLRSRLEQEFAAAGLEANILINAQTIESICALVSAGCGGAVLHPFADHVADMHGLRPVEIEDMSPLELIVIVPPDGNPSKLAAHFIEDVAATLSTLAAHNPLSRAGTRHSEVTQNIFEPRHPFDNFTATKTCDGPGPPGLD
jgi:DNA-binding transcriptional LysR family regulator